MAEEQRVDFNRSRLCCSVCLELLTEPVTVPCGHSYCRSCIDVCWNQEEKEKGHWSCPQCREVFQSRPDLRRNTVLAEVVENLKKSGTKQSPLCADLPLAGPEDVVCDFCCVTKRCKASMSCLTCLASYCPVHLEPHYKVPVLKIHQLVSVSVPLKQKMCPKHNKLMELYCQNDKSCICYLCTLDHHRGHHMVLASAERAEEQKQLIMSRADTQNQLKERKRELKELVQAMKDFKICSQTAVKLTDWMIDDMISSIQKRCSSVTQMILTQEKAAVAKAEKLQFSLEEEISKLKKRSTDLEQLSQTDDHIHFIQSFRSLSPWCQSPNLPLGAVALPHHSMKSVTNSVGDLKVEMESLLAKACSQISATVSAVDVVLPPVPKTRKQFVDNCCSLTLDLNTINRFLSSSEKLKVTCSSYGNYCSAHSDRFTDVKQVLCREGLSGRHYWEVCWTGFCAVAVAYKDISRSATESMFGKNNKSWSLECSSGSYTFRHNSRATTVSGPTSPCIGVYLNHRAGTLCFYSVSDKMTLLHKEQTRFTQPLYPGIRLESQYSYSSNHAELVKLW